VLFATDGEASTDLGSWGSERAAERARQRVGSALFEPSHEACSRATREVAGVEREWRAQHEKAQAVIDAYYQSPTWKRMPYVIGIGLALYVAGMLLYQYFTGQL
jgi:hypothetical protein